MGGLSAVEGGRHILTLGGILGDYPPTEPAGFDAFAASLPFPNIADAIQEAEPLDDPVGFRFPASVRHRCERLRECPDGLLVIGDAVSSFNPVYSQGMTVAANQAMALRRLLAHDTNLSPRQYFRLIAKTVDPPWDIAAGADLASPMCRALVPSRSGWSTPIQPGCTRQPHTTPMAFSTKLAR
jgi:hypothetical protein